MSRTGKDRMPGTPTGSSGREAHGGGRVRMRPHRASRMGLGIAVAVSLGAVRGPGSSLADESGLSLAVQQFEPAPGGEQNFHHVQGAETLGPQGGSLGLSLNTAYRPLVFTSGQGETFDQLQHHLQLDILAALGLGPALQVGFVMPWTLYQVPGEAPQDGPTPVEIPTSAPGDLRWIGKWAVSRSDPLRVALATIIKFPTGDDAALQGNGALVVEPRLILELRPTSQLRIGGNLGYLIRRPQQTYSLTVGHEASWGAAAALALSPKAQLLGEVYGRIGVDALLDPSESDALDHLPFEANAGLRLLPSAGHLLSLGAGGGIGTGYGTPSWRAFLQYAYLGRFETRFFDADGDGIRSRRDGCPEQAEDPDGFQDADGCPDPDNDADGLADGSDLCPLEPEDVDGFRDQDGCPDPDNDADGFTDSLDRCPVAPEDRDGFQDEDGCPDPDNDGDRIPDSSDRCPIEAETYNGLDEEDGCPEPDSDLDGILNDLDRCPQEAETFNGLFDQDGCPEKDSDSDLVPDFADRCPDQPEDRNQVADEDGCPDALAQPVPTSAGMLLAEGPVKLLLYHAVGDASLDARSRAVLDGFVRWLQAHPRVRVRILGFTDADGERRDNRRLSMRRAMSARNYLIEHGISARRIGVQALGPRWPAASNATEEGRELNRRTRLIPIGPDGLEVEALPLELAVPRESVGH